MKREMERNGKIKWKGRERNRKGKERLQRWKANGKDWGRSKGRGKKKRNGKGRGITNTVLF